MIPRLVKIFLSGKPPNKSMKLLSGFLCRRPLSTVTENWQLNTFRKWKIVGPSIVSGSKVYLRQISINPNKGNLSSVQVEGPEKEFKKLEVERKYNSSLSSNLIGVYIDQCQFERSLHRARKVNQKFVLEPTVIKWYVDQCIKNNVLKKAQYLLDEEVNRNPSGKAFASTFIDLSIAMAERGWHEEALNSLRRMVRAKVLILRKGWFADSSRLLNYYTDKGDNIRLQGDIQIKNPNTGKHGKRFSLEL